MTSETSAAAARRMVREHREAEAKYHATLPEQPGRVWRMDADHLGYTHTRCGRHFGPFVDPQQTTEHAMSHDKTCEVPRG